MRKAVLDRVDAVIASRAKNAFETQQVAPTTQAKYLVEEVRACAAEHGLPPDVVRVDVKLAELAARVDDGDGDPATSPVASGRLNLTPKLLDSLLAVENDEDLAARVEELLAAQV